MKRFWDASWDAPGAPTYPRIAALRSARCTMRARPWSARGWAPATPGYAFWIERGDSAAPAVHAGGAMVDAAPAGVFATRCHLFAHRYAKPKASESAKDVLTYHAAVLVEFDDGTATVFEVAWLNGLGGFGARSNWFPADAAPRIYAAMPAGLKLPWRPELLEVRTQDVAFTDKAALEAYLLARSGRRDADRFLDARVTHSASVRVSHRTKRDLFTSVLNYAARDPAYHEESRNCQHFAADFYAFLAGVAPVQPHSKVCRVLYTPRPYYFLYDPRP